MSCKHARGNECEKTAPSISIMHGYQHTLGSNMWTLIASLERAAPDEPTEGTRDLLYNRCPTPCYLAHCPTTDRPQRESPLVSGTADTNEGGAEI